MSLSLLMKWIPGDTHQELLIWPYVPFYISATADSNSQGNVNLVTNWGALVMLW